MRRASASGATEGTRTARPLEQSPPLLCFAGVSVRHPDGERVRTLLQRVSFELQPAGSAGLYGSARSGKSTLMRLACGLQLAQEGQVRFAGRDLRELSGTARARLLRAEIALLAAEGWMPSPGETALDCVAVALGSAQVSLREGRRRALAALDRVGEAACAQETAAALSLDSRARVALARALVREPRLLLVDEPAPLPSINERERFCRLLRDLAAERGIALLVASQDISMLQGLDVLMSISAGEVCSTAPQAEVVPLASRRAAAGRRS
jgi:predicted ABC-type transport system involved in lysophospholipase L1 biosynthesis ATPase subunit